MEMQSKIECKIYENEKNIPYDEWRKFWENCSEACVYNSPGWFIASLGTFKFKRFKVFILRDKCSQKLIGVLPLVKMKIYGVEIYTLPSIEFIDHYSILVDRDRKDAMQILISEIISCGSAYIHGFVSADNEKLAIYKNVNSFVLDDNPYIIFDNDYTDLLENKRENKYLRRARRDFQDVTFSFGISSKKEIIKDVAMIDRKSSKAIKGKAVFNNKNTCSFFETFIDKNKDNIFVSLLYFNKKPVAYNIGFICNGIYAGSQKAHLFEYNKYSPGVIIFEELLHAISRQNPKELNMGRGRDIFKITYTNKVRKLYGVVISRNKLVGLYINLMHNAKIKVYKLISSNKNFYIFYKKIKVTMLS